MKRSRILLFSLSFITILSCSVTFAAFVMDYQGTEINPNIEDVNIISNNNGYSFLTLKEYSGIEKDGNNPINKELNVTFEFDKTKFNSEENQKQEADQFKYFKITITKDNDIFKDSSLYDAKCFSLTNINGKSIIFYDIKKYTNNSVTLSLPIKSAELFDSSYFLNLVENNIETINFNIDFLKIDSLLLGKFTLAFDFVSSEVEI